jgi:hypothetical protein
VFTIIERSLPSIAIEDKQIATTVKNVSYNNVQVSKYTEIHATIYHEILDAEITEMAISIKNLTPEQLFLAIKSLPTVGLSDLHLEAIIIASQQHSTLVKSEPFG